MTRTSVQAQGWCTHIAVDHGCDVVLVEVLDGWRCKEEVGVVGGIAPLEVVDLGVSNIPLIAKSKNELDPICTCLRNDIVQSPECRLVVDTCSVHLYLGAAVCIYPAAPALEVSVTLLLHTDVAQR